MLHLWARQEFLEKEKITKDCRTVIASPCHMQLFLYKKNFRLYVELGLTAEMESALSIASFAGFAFCHLFWGWVADRFGRRTYALWSSLWIVFWSLLCIVAPTYSWLIAFRLIYSLAGGELDICWHKSFLLYVVIIIKYVAFPEYCFVQWAEQCTHNNCEVKLREIY